MVTRRSRKAELRQCEKCKKWRKLASPPLLSPGTWNCELGGWACNMAEDSPPKKLNIMSRNTNDENSLDSQSASETDEKEMTSSKKDDKKTSENEAKAVRISRRQREKRDKGGRSNKNSKQIKESGKRKSSLDSEKRNVKPKVESKVEKETEAAPSVAPEARAVPVAEYTNYDTCYLCRDGGELLICLAGTESNPLGCEKSFHLPCIGRGKMPDGDWLCTPCAKSMSLEITNKNPNYGYEFPSDDASDADLEVQRDVWKKLSIGSRIAVYWVDDDQYYNATVSQQYGSSSTFQLDYDDGVEEKLDLSREEIMLLSSDEEEEDDDSFANLSLDTFSNVQVDEEKKEEPKEKEVSPPDMNELKAYTPVNESPGVPRETQLRLEEIWVLACKLSPKEILCGRGLSKISVKRSGYLEFRKMVDESHKEYDLRPQGRRRVVCVKVVDAMRAKGIRFVQWNKNKQMFQELSYERSIGKVMQTFRDVRGNKISVNDGSKEETNRQATIANALGPNDIPCGRGYNTAKMERRGYLVFRRLIDTMIDEYSQAYKQTSFGISSKRRVCQKVFHILKEQKIRFVQFSQSEAKWLQVSDERAIGKIMQTFRDIRNVKPSSSPALSTKHEPIRHDLLINAKKRPSKRVGDKSGKRKRVSVDPYFLVNSSKKSKRKEKQVDLVSEEEEEETVQQKYIDILRRRAKEASAKAISEKVDGGPCRLVNKKNFVCHICHKRMKETYSFQCGNATHAYCVTHCKTRLGIGTGKGEKPFILDYCPICSVNCTCSKCTRKATIVAGELKKVSRKQRKDPSKVKFQGILAKINVAKMPTKKSKPTKLSFVEELAMNKTKAEKEQKEEEEEESENEDQEENNDDQDGEFTFSQSTDYYNNDIEDEMSISPQDKTLDALLDVATQYHSTNERQQDPYKYFASRQPPIRLVPSIQEGLINEILMASRKAPRPMPPPVHGVNRAAFKTKPVESSVEPPSGSCTISSQQQFEDAIDVPPLHLQKKKPQQHSNSAGSLTSPTMGISRVQSTTQVPKSTSGVSSKAKPVTPYAQAKSPTLGAQPLGSPHAQAKPPPSLGTPHAHAKPPPLIGNPLTHPKVLPSAAHASMTHFPKAKIPPVAQLPGTPYTQAKGPAVMRPQMIPYAVPLPPVARIPGAPVPVDVSSKLRFKDFQVATWTQRFQEATEFKRQHGHCIIPHDYPPNQELARWAKRQRYQYQLHKNKDKKSYMTEERIRVLNELGFCWHHKLNIWHVRYGELLSFIRSHGHTVVPSHYAANPKLATWVKCQRRQKKLKDAGRPHTLTGNREQLLNSIKFAWTVQANPRQH